MDSIDVPDKGLLPVEGKEDGSGGSCSSTSRLMCIHNCACRADGTTLPAAGW